MQCFHIRRLEGHTALEGPGLTRSNVRKIGPLNKKRKSVKRVSGLTHCKGCGQAKVRKAEDRSSTEACSISSSLNFGDMFSLQIHRLVTVHSFLVYICLSHCAQLIINWLIDWLTDSLESNTVLVSTLWCSYLNLNRTVEQKNIILWITICLTVSQ